MTEQRSPSCENNGCRVTINNSHKSNDKYQSLRIWKMNDCLEFWFSIFSKVVYFFGCIDKISGFAINGIFSWFHIDCEFKFEFWISDCLQWNITCLGEYFFFLFFVAISAYLETCCTSFSNKSLYKPCQKQLWDFIE